MTDATLRQALAFAARGWPVLPCQPGQKTPATRHGLRDATTDPGRSPPGSAATPTGTWRSPPAHPDPTSWTSTSTARPATGTPPSPRCPRPACWTAPPPTSAPPAADCTPTSRGTDQRNGHLPGHHLDFRSRGGYVLAPPSHVDGKPYQLIRTVDADGALDWAAVTALLEPQRQATRPQPSTAPART